MKYKLFILTIAIVLFSCKKSSNTNSNSGSGSSTNSTISPSSATSFYGIFISGTTRAIVGGVLLAPNYYVSDAYFSSTPVFYPDGTSVITVDSVKANGRPLQYLSFDYMYEDTTGFSTSGNQVPINFPITWHVAGKNGIPSFTYLDATPFPSYSGYNLIPDTINHVAGLIFTLSGVANMDYASVSVDDGSGHGASTTIGNNVTTVTIPASDMSQLTPTNTGTLSINFQKRNVENVYGKAMLFTTSSTMTKKISIK